MKKKIIRFPKREEDIHEIQRRLQQLSDLDKMKNEQLLKEVSAIRDKAMNLKVKIEKKLNKKNDP